MKLSNGVLSGWVALGVLVGCVGDPSEIDDDLAYAEEELSASNWSAMSTVGTDLQGARHGGAVATLNGVTYMVHSGDCDDCNELWWTKLGPSGWTNDVRIANQLAADKVSLAAFNGYLYMVHTGNSDTTEVWLSRFDPRTEQWSPNVRLAYRSKETPAIAQYGGLLYIVGIQTASPNRLWMATMDAAENISAQRVLVDTSTSRASLAVYGGRLYRAHRQGSSNRVVYSVYDGATWSVSRAIPVGDGTELQGAVPAIAAYDGHLHLVVKRPGSSAIWWTSFDGSQWAAPVTLFTWGSHSHPALGNGTDGLLLVANDRCPSRHVCSAQHLLKYSRYTTPALGFVEPRGI